VMLTDDWTRSAGARGEVKEAVRLGIPCFLSTRLLGAWIEGAPTVETAIGPAMLRDVIQTIEGQP
jgi:hypothetical protein